MEPIGFTTDQMSWTFLISALRRVQADDARVPTIGFNLEASSCIVLSCVAVEAFVNELSSLTHAFLFKQRRIDQAGYASAAHAPETPEARALRDVAQIRLDGDGSFYKRYKRVLREFGIETPIFLSELCTLKKVRDALVHFRECDVPIVDDQRAIRYNQELPAAIAELRKQNYEGVPVIACAPDVVWSLRLATDAMAAWSLGLALESATYVLEHLPPGEFRSFARKAYADSNPAFDTVFMRGSNDLTAWWKTVAQRQS